MTLNPVRYAPVWMFCAAIFCAVPLLAHQPSTPVTAVVLPDGHYSKLALREMDREASHILKQSGVSQDFLEHRRSRFPVVVVLPIDNQGADGWRSKRL